MAFCTECGTNVPDDVKFCTSCGKPMGAPAQPQPAMAGASGADSPPQPQSAVPQAATAVLDPPRAAPQPAAVSPPASAPAPTGEAIPGAGSKYQPISTGGWIGIMLLMCIPIVGQILLIVWACGGCKKVTKRSFARASLILFVIVLLLSLVFGLIFRSVIGNVIDNARQEAGISDSSGLGGLLNGLGGNSGGDSDLSSLLGALGGLDALTGGQGGGNQDGNDGADASGGGGKTSSGGGWPKELRPYPSGTATQPMDYRTEITGSNRDEMIAYIDSLRGDGFVFQDFLEFGFSEQEMLDDMNGWWATDGKLYISVSIIDDTITIDYMDEKPTAESLMEAVGW